MDAPRHRRQQAVCSSRSRGAVVQRGHPMPEQLAAALFFAALVVTSGGVLAAPPPGGASVVAAARTLHMIACCCCCQAAAAAAAASVTLLQTPESISALSLRAGCWAQASRGTAGRRSRRSAFQAAPAPRSGMSSCSPKSRSYAPNIPGITHALSAALMTMVFGWAGVVRQV